MTEIKQRTIGSSVSLSGNGLHTGSAVNLVFRPADVNHGIVFLRTDIGPDARVEADALLVSDTSRGTTLERDGIKVVTVEHVMAAAAGLQIDNLIVELDGPELPIMDGSSIAFVRALQDAGIVEQDAPREFFEVREPIRFYHEEKDCEFIALPSEHFRASCMIDYGSKVLGHQHASLNNLEDFAAEIAPCRTFVFLHELEFLVEQNLIKGGDLSNAIVFVENPVSPESIDRLSKLFNKPKVEVLPQGMLNNVECYFDNEPARHKLLDVIGDLALAGRPIRGHIIASRPGHESNVLFAREIKKRIREQKLSDEIPVYDPSKPVVYDIMGIQRLLPHRHPFLFVDKIIDIGPDYVVGVKNVTMNEAFFTGHFPSEPVMPGVLIVEAMAQTGGILFLAPVEDPENYYTYFLKIDNVKFKQKVVPGDTLIFKLSLLSPVRRGICHMKGMAYVGNKLVMEAELMAQIGKNQ